MDYILANLDWCETLRRFNNHYNEITRQFDKEGYIHHIQKVDIKRKYSSAETILLLKQTDGIRKLKSAELTEHFAPFLIEILQPEIGSLFEAQLKTEQFFSHVRIAVALSRWRQEHGSYPESLDEMVPKILDEDPMDQFIDEPLFYEKTAEGCRFYSVGVNATDNHGREDDLQVSLRDPGAAKK